MSLTRFLVPIYTLMLQSLSAWLDKAVAQEAASGRDVDGLASLRLAPDMFPLAAQIRFACFQAQEPIYRLRDEPVPESLAAVRNEGANAGAEPGTMAAAQARIAEALAFLATLAPDAIDRGAPSPIVFDLPNGMIFDITDEQYARDWALPQFYFHLVTAYAILRHHGVELGKADYVAYMMAYLRPGSTPQG